MAKKPAKRQNDARGDTLRIRLTDEERALINEAAKFTGLETSTWARVELLGLSRKLLGKRK